MRKKAWLRKKEEDKRGRSVHLMPILNSAAAVFLKCQPVAEHKSSPSSCLFLLSFPPIPLPRLRSTPLHSFTPRSFTTHDGAQAHQPRRPHLIPTPCLLLWLYARQCSLHRHFPQPGPSSRPPPASREEEAC